LNVRFPKGGVPVIETTKSDRKVLCEAHRLLSHVALVTADVEMKVAASCIEHFLAEQEAAPQPVVG
jgi:hypothetical protein